MNHSDDHGRFLPPKLAPFHVAIVPIYRKDRERTAVLEAANRIASELRADGLTVEVNDREGIKNVAPCFLFGSSPLSMLQIREGNACMRSMNPPL